MRTGAAGTAAVVALVVMSCGGDDVGDTTAATPATAAPMTATPTSASASQPSTPAPSTTTASPPGTVVGQEPTRGVTTPTPSTPPPMTGDEPAVTLAEIGTYDTPTDLAWRAGDDALYVVERAGTIQRVAGDDATTVLDITDLTDTGSEHGLLGLTFSPSGDLAYIDYTDVNGDTTIAEHTVADDGTFGAGARTVLRIEQPYDNHNGGDLTFGPDGMLYIGMGDGGAGGDPERRASDPTSLLGKMLRIDPTPSGDRGYIVPPDNPFVHVGGSAPEVWASGLRNPWRFSFDRVSGDLWIADVGQNAVEEIDVAAADDGVDAGKGESFGWSALEGNAPYNDDVAIEDPVPPFSTYRHDLGCSISGGVRPRIGPLPDLVGWYVYGDYCAGQVWALEVLGDGGSMVAGRQVVLGDLPAITAVVDGPQGEVYALSGEGTIVRLDPPN